ncbi:hypothetical protein L8C07_12445 [Paenibacillus sp. CMAA1739]|uniref:hypothetical protein n=1 Tax=Paenibacillus ottowii TaxID=2315729 RepID=UPI002DBDBA75|nr:hypothetical protein [Paenibacillus sp. CMAA1739]MEC4566757.1 hypothetical protein [Paenibacillus sp. CMAA1739]
MNDLSIEKAEEITVSIHLVNREIFEYYYPADELENVEVFLSWYKKPGRDKVFTIHTPHLKEIRSLNHENIVFVSVDGYIEPYGRESRWYERLIDRFRLWRMTR